MEPPPTPGEGPSKATVVNPLPFLAGLLNALIAVLWFAGAAFGLASFGAVCLAPGFFAVLAAVACYRRANWWIALGLTVLAANALSLLLLLLSRKDFEAPAASAPP